MTTILSYIHYSVFFVYLILAIYTICKNSSSILHRSVFALLLFFAFWSLSYTIIYYPSAKQQLVKVAIHLATLSVGGYGVTTFLSIGFYTKKVKPSKLLFTGIALYGIFFAFVQLGGYFAYAAENDLFRPIAYKSVSILIILNVFHIIYTVGSFILLALFKKQTTETYKKQQAKVILFTGVIAYILASLNVHIPQFIPSIRFPIFNDVCVLVFAAGLVYSIIHLEIFEITPSTVANQIIEMMPVGLILTDSKQHVVRVNTTLLEITNQKKQDFMNHSLNDVFRYLTNKHFDFVENESLSTQVAIDTDKQEKKTIFWVTQKIWQNHNEIGAISIINDIDQLVQTEKQLKQLNNSLEEKICLRTKELRRAKEKAEESDRLKSAFLQNISHEIRTPMNAISGFAHLLNKNNLSTEKRRHYTKIIMNSSEQLLSIVTDVLAISSLETKQVKIKQTPTNINAILDEFLIVYQNKISDKAITISLSKSLGNELSTIETDASKLKQILNNLLNNALKFTEKGHITFGYTTKSEYLEFYVKDTGIGIQPEMHEQIFERFIQADQSITINYGGTGLGLSIARSYTELLGGKIRVESELNKGTTFLFTIPYVQHHNKQQATGVSKTPKINKTVLIAEDEKYNYLLIKEILSTMDCNILHAANGQQVVDLCNQRRDIALVIMDLKMPILSGEEAAEKIKQKYPEMPVIAYTAYVTKQDAQQLNMQIFSGLITKPIQRKTFIEMVQKYLTKS